MSIGLQHYTSLSNANLNMAWKSVKRQLSSNVLALISSSRRKDISVSVSEGESEPKAALPRYYSLPKFAFEPPCILWPLK
jgi:hypothetical protein